VLGTNELVQRPYQHHDEDAQPQQQQRNGKAARGRIGHGGLLRIGVESNETDAGPAGFHGNAPIARPMHG
jgi:hypothetical protein